MRTASNAHSVARSRRGAVARGDRIRQLRLANALTATALAERAGLTDRTIRKAESSTSIAPATAAAIADALGVPICDVIVMPSDLPQRAQSLGFGLPHETEHLVGRAADLDRARQTLTRSGHVCFSGTSGIGKSRLALELARRTQNDGGAVLWVPCTQRAGRTAAAEVQLKLAELLGVHQRLPALTKETPPASVHAAFHDATSEIPITIVLDDATSRSFLQSFLADGPAQRSLIVTTRRRGVSKLLGGSTLAVNPLENASVIRLLACKLGEDRVAGDTEGAGAFCKLTGGAPRAVLAAAATLQRESVVSLADFVAACPDDWSVDTLSQSQRGIARWGLSLDAARCVSTLAETGFSLTLQQLSTRLDMDVRELARALSELDDNFLCEVTPRVDDEPARFRCPPHVRAVLWQ